VSAERSSKKCEPVSAASTGGVLRRTIIAMPRPQDIARRSSFHVRSTKFSAVPASASIKRRWTVVRLSLPPRSAVRRQVLWQSGSVLSGLSFHSSKGAFGLGFNGAGGFAVEIEKIVGKTESGFHREIAHGDATASG
jgi:hypothetical protein